MYVSIHSLAQSLPSLPKNKNQLRGTLQLGGDGGNRTHDILLAKQTLSHLSYAPDKWWAWKDLNFRPHAYQACALAT